MRPADLASAFFALLLTIALQGCVFGERNDVLILVRDGDPVSRAIGDYYADARNIPAHRILTLSLSNAAANEAIDRATFESEIGDPIEAYLAAADPAHEIQILVTTLGIPLRIEHCKAGDVRGPGACRSSAVDAALAGLGRLAAADRPIFDQANPYFGELRSFADFRREDPSSKLRFLVARLAGSSTLDRSKTPLPTSVRRLIDRAQGPGASDAGHTTEWRVLADAVRTARSAATNALIDPVHDLMTRAGHHVCDGCSAETKAAQPVGVILQSGGTSLANGRADRPTTSTTSERLAFPGIVLTLGEPAGDHQRFDRFLGSWVSRGAGAISTHLADPSLAGVTRPARQFRAWIEGRSAVEAHFSSVPLLGWTNVFVGDPLLSAENLVQASTGDLDFDGVPDGGDNCLDLANPEQLDSDADGFGNRCDPDVNNDGRVATSWGRIYPVDRRGDLEAIALTARNGPFNPEHDLDGDGRVDERDLSLAQLWLFRAPGPSGIAR